MSHDLARRILEAPTADIGVWPTPIDTVATARRGPEVLVKRDDLSGHGRGGAKARKLDCLVGHLVRHGHDELIAVAGNVTNLAFDLLPALDRYGIHARLFILDDPIVDPADREIIFAGVRDRVCLLGSSRARAIGAMMGAYVRSRRAGRRPFVALPGVSHPSGVLGNARGFMEMVLQQRARNERVPETVYVTAATGTTLAGFLLGEHALRSLGFAPIRIVGVQIYPGAIRRWTAALVRWTERFLGVREMVPASRVEVAHDELHGGFGQYSGELADLCARVASDTKLLIDPIFGGKTWAVMERRLARERRPGATLYWHCGYTPEWMALGHAVQSAKAAA
jgi:1-aminocyclopropane-1-carboxylate deaminase/D-cysteine desulfhydrase-like pyridoxal-dependent ACC family enzyme